MFADQSLITNPRENYFSFLARKWDEGKFPNPSEMITGSSHIVVIDSRERNKTKFPSPSHYSIRFSDTYKNITSIELKGTVLPKTEYNVHTSNNKLSFNVEDSITQAIIKDGGEGYQDGVYGFGAVPPNDTMVNVSPPAINGGTNAQLTVTVTGGSITSVVIANSGLGYLRGTYGTYQDPANGFYRNSSVSVSLTIPFQPDSESFKRRANIQLEVGHELVAELRPGQYDFAVPNDSAAGLCAEVTRALQAATQNAIDSGILVPIVGGPQTGVEYFPTGTGNTGSCFLFTPNLNASENSNVAIQRGDPANAGGGYQQYQFLELLFSNSTTIDENMSRVLGYGSEYIQTLGNTPLDQTSGVLNEIVAWSSTPIESQYDYCLTDFPKYCILTFGATSSTTAERIESTNATLDRGFATLIFDANAQDVVYRDPNGSALPGAGDSNYNSLLSKPGTLKGIKGADFDAKVLSFGPVPKAELYGVSIEFKKYNGDYYDFHGKDHLLIFQLNANDINSGNRW